MAKWILLIIFIYCPGFSQTEQKPHGVSMQSDTPPEWSKYLEWSQSQLANEQRDGISYIISGSLAVIGGVIGGSLSTDHVERGMYTVFQTIGLASVGYGAHMYWIGSSDRRTFEILNNSTMSYDARLEYLRAAEQHRQTVRRRERILRIATHALIAGLNVYSASIQGNETIRNGLYFVGGLNALAAISYSIDF
jgi:hypothetical protein